MRERNTEMKINRVWAHKKRPGVLVLEAAYRNGRGMIVQLLTTKMLAQKAATIPNYTTHIST